MIIKCEECICMPICINQVIFTKQEGNSFTYTMTFNGLTEKCNYFNEAWNADTYLYQQIKKFFLKQKGLI